jgi:signal transduction histidine kinase
MRHRVIAAAAKGSEPLERGGSTRQGSLAELPPTRKQRNSALAIILIMLAAFVGTAPFGALQLPGSTAFIAAIQTIMFVNDLITATLLFAYFTILLRPSLLAVASGYLFTALIAVPYALTFPGLFSATGLLDANRQTAGWLYAAWHCGLPLAIIGYAWPTNQNQAGKDSFFASPRASIGLCVAIVIATVCGATWVAVAAKDVMPKIFLDEVHVSPFAQNIGVMIMALSGLALAILWSRPRTVLNLWLMVAVAAWLLELAFFGVLTPVRFSLAFYTSRIYAVAAASIVLLVLLSETTTLHLRLARSTAMQLRERESRVISMGVVSASIAHEMSQPVGAMMASAEAALLWLAKTPPNVANARTSIERIMIDGRRASELIESVRALFRKNNSKEELVDVNELIREVLTIEHEEFGHRRIRVKAELDEAIPSVLFDRIQLQQVVLNLITNAVEAMNSVTDRPRVLQVTSQKHGQSQVAIAVADTGTGIDRETIDQVFEPFFTTKPRGMGLGLWICRTIVEHHNGQLMVASEPERGSVFRIILPNNGSEGAAPQSLGA